MTAVLAGAVRTVVRLRRDATLALETGIEVTSPFCVLRFRELPAGITGALATLAETEVDQEDLAASVIEQDGPAALMRFQMVLLRLDAEGLLERSVLADETPLARLRPVGRGKTAWGATPDPATAVKISRFAIARAENGLLVLRAPGSHLAVDLAPEAAQLLGAFADWQSPEKVADLPAEAVAGVLRAFRAARLLVDGGQDQDPEARPESAQWDPADLWFHARTRGPETVPGYGGTYPGKDRWQPLPASPPARGSRIVKLAKPNPATDDPPLTRVIEERRSIREHDDANPITVEQLSELLYRCVRQRGTFTASDGQEVVDRPYPSGGALYELEVYPLVTSCQGLESGLWHYRGDTHELEFVTEPGPATQALVAGARAGAMMESDPQVTLLVSARFGRVMWKYETVGYPLILKHTGVLYQTFYLVGTAMRLAVCGLGGGDTAHFAAATGLDPLAEGTVGELVVGSRPAVPRHPAGFPAGDSQEGRA